MTNWGNYRRYIAVGTQLIVRLLHLSDNSDPVGNFLARVNEIFEYALQDMGDSIMVWITIQNQVNQNDKHIGISFSRNYHLSGEAVWSVFERVSQYNALFNALDTLVGTVNSVKMPVGFGYGITTKGRPLSLMAHLKKGILELKAEKNCLAHALI